MTETKENYSFNLAKILPETVLHNNLKILEALLTAPVMLARSRSP